jgi:hypothetical protein
MLRIDSRYVRALGALGAAAVLTLLASCGGGGGGSSATPTTGSMANAPAGSNQVAVTVSSGLFGTAANIPSVSVTICQPGTNNCQTIDNIQVDTESFGLRLAGTAVSQVLGSLPYETSGGSQLAECVQFGDGYTWGSVRSADVTIGGETASSLPIQIMGDMSSATEPASVQSQSNGCGMYGEESTVSQLGVNGILGVGVALNDCGPDCSSATNSLYFACPGGANCTGVAVSSQAVANPVSRFASDNNGVNLTMQSIGALGAPTATGTLTFGIGTRANNTMGASHVLASDGSGDFNASLQGVASAHGAFFDSGSNAYYFASTLSDCTGVADNFYCPPVGTPSTFDVSVASFNNASPGAPGGLSLTMTVDNGTELLTNGAGGGNGNYAFDDLAGSGGGGLSGFVDLGLPFFYGRTVYYGYDFTGSGGPAPYVAF